MILNEKQNTRKEQAAETRRRLLEAATKLFAESGYARTSVRSISKSIGMADGLMYHYFPGGKEEIIQEIVHEKLRQVVSESNELLKEMNNLAIEEVIEGLYQNWTKIFDRHQDILKILMKENDVMQFVGYDSILSILQGVERLFPQYLKKQAEAGVIQRIDFDSAADILLATLLGHFFTKMIGNGKGVLDNEERRKKLIESQINLWKSPQPNG